MKWDQNFWSYWYKTKAQSVLNIMIQSLLQMRVLFAGYNWKRMGTQNTRSCIFTYCMQMGACTQAHFCEGAIGFQESAETSLQRNRQGNAF